MTESMKPPWLEFPRLPAGDIGWRMGDGEGYLNEFVAWIVALEDGERKLYLDGLRPIPSDWHELVAELYIYPSEDEDELQAAWDSLQ